MRLLCYGLSVLLLASCGSGNSPSSSSSALSQLSSQELLLAQTHVLPKEGLSWTLTDINGNTKTTKLELIAQRDALVMIDLGQSSPINPVLEVWLNQNRVDTLALNAPIHFPATEATGSSFRSSSYTASIPAKWMKQGLDLKVNADNYQVSAFLGPINISNHGDLVIKMLPFYVYGASPSMGGAPALAQTQMPDQATQDETFAKWPVSTLTTQTHGAGLIQWPYMVIPPRKGNAAYRALSKNEQKDGFDTMSAVLKVLHALRNANGEASTNNLYYAPLIMWDNTGTYSSPGGGLGGGHVGTGDFAYQGIYIHEQGHALSLPHQGTAYLEGKYPYIDGSLKGSVWGYDQIKQEFLAPYVPSTASRYANCHTTPATRPVDSQGRCVKRDPMWGGDGDQAAGYKFATFSDFSTGQMQANINNMIFEDVYSVTGFSKWDNATKQRVDVQKTTTSKGLDGLDGGLPATQNVPVQTIVVTFSKAPCDVLVDPYATCNAAGVNTNISQIYPPVAYTGNLLRTIDPTVPADLASIVPNTSANPWYCHDSGCDYTLRITYADTTVQYIALQGGFRPWFSPTGAVAATRLEPLNGASFRFWSVNVTGAKAIAKVELLDTPQLWNGLPAAPTVLISR